MREEKKRGTSGRADNLLFLQSSSKTGFMDHLSEIREGVSGTLFKSKANCFFFIVTDWHSSKNMTKTNKVHA